MTVTISAALNEARLTGVQSYLDSGSLSARIRLYDGTRPTGGGAATLLLAEIALDKPCGVVSGGVLTLAASELAIIAASGIATWARVVNGNGDYAFDCDVSETGGIGEIQLESTTLYAGGNAELTSAVLG